MSNAPFELVLSRLSDARKNGKGWIATCPCHEDGTPSLSVREGRNGGVVIHCHARCPTP